MAAMPFRGFLLFNFYNFIHFLNGLVLEHSLLSGSIFFFPSVEDGGDLKLPFLCNFYCETVKGKLIV
jgi:hypothetical protein